MGRAVVEGLWLRYQGLSVEEDVERERRRRVLQTLVWFLLTLLLALFIPDIGKVIAVIGGLAACFIFVFPGAEPDAPVPLPCSMDSQGFSGLCSPLALNLPRKVASSTQQ